MHPTNSKKTDKVDTYRQVRNKAIILEDRDSVSDLAIKDRLNATGYSTEHSTNVDFLKEELEYYAGNHKDDHHVMLFVPGDTDGSADLAEKAQEKNIGVVVYDANLSQARTISSTAANIEIKDSEGPNDIAEKLDIAMREADILTRRQASNTIARIDSAVEVASSPTTEHNQNGIER